MKTRPDHNTRGTEGRYRLKGFLIGLGGGNALCLDFHRSTTAVAMDLTPFDGPFHHGCRVAAQALRFF